MAAKGTAMGMARRFDMLFEQVMGMADPSSLDMSKFNFKKDDAGNIFCTFSTRRDGYRLNVIAKKVNGVISFDVTNEDGKSHELTEKKFAVIYSLDYDDFRKALDKFTEAKADGGAGSAPDPSKPKVKPFDAQLKGDGGDGLKDERVKMVKTVTVGDATFIFGMLNDPAVDNYCECSFQWQDEASSEITYFKALIDIKVKNSLIIKIVEMDSDGRMLGVIAASELEERLPELFRMLKAAIKKMELIVWDS